MTTTTQTVDLKPIPSDLADKLREAVALRDEIRQFIDDTLDGSVDTVYFVGCGGSLLSTYPVQFLLETHAGDVAVFHMNADEFVHRAPARVGKRSLVFTASHSGSTKETVAATEAAIERGATVVALTQKPESPLAETAERVFVYPSVEAKQVVLGLIGWSILRALGTEADYDAIDQAFDAYPDALAATLEDLEPRLEEIAQRLQDEQITYLLGAGPNYGAAATLAMCYLQEMQWMDAAAFNAGEFFHGAFEVVTSDTPVILLLGEDATRPMAERAKTFLDQYTEKGVYIDSRDFTLPGIPDELREHFTASVFYAVVGRLAAHYAAARNHDLDTRRYMWKVEY